MRELARTLHHRTLALTGLLVLSVACPPTLLARTAHDASPLPTACEVALARSAAPSHLRDAAGVWVMTAEGYREHAASSNGFVCIVNRDRPEVLKPTCFDAEGAATIVPKIVAVGGWLAEGVTVEQVRSRVEEGFQSGRFVRPSRPGIAYMLSQYNRPWQGPDQPLGRFPPHVMFYAPDLTNEDIGFRFGTSDAMAGDPFIGYQGPHGYMIVITGTLETEPTPVDPSCPAWIEPRADTIDR